MHSAMLFIMKPDTLRTDGMRQWQEFLGDIESAKPEPTNTEMLADNCWLIPLDSGASFMAVVVAMATGCELGHRILFFERAPQWVQLPKSKV